MPRRMLIAFFQLKQLECPIDKDNKQQNILMLLDSFKIKNDSA